MDDEIYVLFIKYDELYIYGLGKRRAYGMEARWFCDGVEYKNDLEHDEYTILGILGPAT